jgi:hypothetical protein
MDLYEALPGSVGKIYWYEIIERELADKEIESIRQKSISEALSATLTNLMYEPSKAINNLDGVIKRGWDGARKQIEYLQSGTIIKSEYIMVDSSSKSLIEEIENRNGFMNWTNPYIIEEIKSLCLEN